MPKRIISCHKSNLVSNSDVFMRSADSGDLAQGPHTGNKSRPSMLYTSIEL